MKKNNIKTLAVLFFLAISARLFSQNIAINTTGNAAYTSAILDLSNNNSPGTVGLLPPYVTFTLPLSNFQLSGTASQSSGLIVYNTGGFAPEGLYYWDNTIPSWIAISGGSSSLAGLGTMDYLARWTPNGTTLGIGVVQDNGASVAINTVAIPPSAAQMLTVTGNSTAVNAILGTTAQSGGFGVEGSVTNAGISGGYGIEGLISGTGGGSSYALYGVSTVTGGNSYGVYGSATGTASINYGGYFNASGATNNYGLVVPNTGGFSGFYTTTPVNTVDVYGSIGTQISTALVTSPTTLDETYHTVLANPAGGAFTITIPGGAATNERREYTIVYAPSSPTNNAVTISPSSGGIYLGSTLYTASSPLIFSSGSVTLQSNGGNWYVTNAPSLLGLGQYCSTVASTGGTSLAVTGNAYAVPGLTQTFTLANACNVLIQSMGGVEQSNYQGTAFIYIWIVVDANSYFMESFMMDYQYSYLNDFNMWSFSYSLPLTAGSHTVTVYAEKGQVAGAVGTITAGGPSGNVLQGALTITAVHN